jgi:hypothetical protein
VELRRYLHTNVYHRETPLTLSAKASWHEGVDYLLKCGAKTDKVVSYLSPKEQRYHDVRAMLQALGIT